MSGESRRNAGDSDPELEQNSGLIPEEDLVPEDDRVIGVAFRWSATAIFMVALVVVAAILYFGRETKEEVELVERGEIEAPPELDQSSPEMPTVAFTDITAESGIDFLHVSGAVGEKFLPETMGGGVAALDFDSDGDQDLLFVNSKQWDGADDAAATMALYRNDGSGNFDNATAGSGLDASFYGQGIAAGDYDNDGDVDVFITTLGHNRFYRNDGGVFTDVSAAAGTQGESDRWSSSAGFFDYDNDGDLDLYVCNYVVWSPDIDRQLNFTLNGTDRAYGPPKQYQGTHSYLYRNEGDGTFVDVSEQAGIRIENPSTGKPMGKALAVTFVDADGDGWQDILVANDTVQNFAFRNLGDGTFEELGATSGMGFDHTGNATGAMGIDVGDVGNDGFLSIGIGNFANETTSFYVQQNNPWQFVDMANQHGIGSPSRLKLSFGLFFFDYDLDGGLDMLQANGHLEDEINEVQPSQQYHQPAQLFWNCGSPERTCFAAVAEDAMGDLANPIVGRGAIYLDADGDGDLDVLLSQTGGAPLLVRNSQQLGHHWLRVKLIGKKANRDAIGSWLEIKVGERQLRRQVMPTRSYLSQVELPVTFGLGAADSVDALRVHWPDGSVQDVEVDAVDTTLVIEEAG